MKPWGRAVRPPQEYGGYYSRPLGGGRHTIHLYVPGSRTNPDIYVSTQYSREAAERELALLRHGGEL